MPSDKPVYVGYCILAFCPAADLLPSGLRRVQANRVYPLIFVTSPHDWLFQGVIFDVGLTIQL